MPDRKVKDIRIARAVRLIESNFAEDFDFNRLAESLNLSAPRLRQLFKEQTGMPFRKYLRLIRMKEAQHLLETTFLTVKEIAKQVGVHDSSNFIKDFEKQFGLSPTKYRNIYLPRKEKAASANYISTQENSRSHRNG